MALTENQQKFINEINMIHRGKMTLGNALEQIKVIPSDFESKFNIEDLSNIAAPLLVSDLPYIGVTVTEQFHSRTTANGVNVVNGSYAEIQNIEGKTVKSKNLLSMSDLEDNNNWVKSGNDYVYTLNIKNNTTYNLSATFVPDDDYYYGYFRLRINDANVYAFVSGKTFKSNSYTFTTDDLSTYSISFYCKDKKPNEVIGTYYNDIMLVEGSVTPTEYLPYFEGLKNTNISKLTSTNADGTKSSEVSINQELKEWDGIYKANNLLSIDDVDETTINGVTYSIKDGVITRKGTATTSATEFFNLKKSILLNGTYKLATFNNKTNSASYLTLRNANNELAGGVVINLSTQNNNGTINTTTFVATKIGIGYVSGETYNDIIKPILVEGSVVPTQYLPYTDKPYMKVIGSEERAYQEGDTTNSTMITDGTTTVVKLATPTYTPLDAIYQYQVWKDGNEALTLDNDYALPNLSIEYIVKKEENN